MQINFDRNDNDCLKNAIFIQKLQNIVRNIDKYFRRLPQDVSSQIDFNSRKTQLKVLLRS